MGLTHGRVSVVSGASGKQIMSVGGGGNQNLFGRSVCGLGDVDHDGVGDFAVGAPHEDSAGMDSGRVLVYLGAVSSTCSLRSLGPGSSSAGGSPPIRLLGTPSLESLLLLEYLDPPLLRAADPAYASGLSWPGAPVSVDATDPAGMLLLGARGWPPAVAGLTIRLRAMNVIDRPRGASFQLSNPLVQKFGL